MKWPIDHKKTLIYAGLSRAVYGDKGDPPGGCRKLKGGWYSGAVGVPIYQTVPVPVTCPDGSLGIEEKKIKLIPEFSGQAYVCEPIKEIVFAIRGTALPNLFDVLSDIQIGVHTAKAISPYLIMTNPILFVLIQLIPPMLPHHFGESRNFFNSVTLDEKNNAEYNELTLEKGYKVGITGHSLGGACAQFLALHLVNHEYISDKVKIHTETFNAAGVLAVVKNLGIKCENIDSLEIINHMRYSDWCSYAVRGHLGECRYYAHYNPQKHGIKEFEADLRSDHYAVYYSTREEATAARNELRNKSYEHTPKNVWPNNF